ncbi:unnamed protein product [Trifolium pratense]|uniref:Uncharacterized protein n=1 Tax=Trifolium pratense TaxID=57577 RepID=A0ACB0M6F1_TRIPR|nr:unnamed protein product [Trifolium pratense]
MRMLHTESSNPFAEKLQRNTKFIPSGFPLNPQNPSLMHSFRFSLEFSIPSTALRRHAPPIVPSLFS